ncbi:MAG: hypothetical protein KDD38_07715 [Bdellovibrionales bacterium]|nr:hypothetical protein [Bdellovibrionales bacterium]
MIMNIRTLSNPISPVESIKTGEVRDVKTQVSSEDRDADGRRSQEEPDKNPLSEEESRRALEYLENLTGLTANGLSVEVEESGEFKIYLIKDQNGEVARRIVEWEMRALIDESNKKTGQIFDKSA